MWSSIQYVSSAFYVLYKIDLSVSHSHHSHHAQCTSFIDSSQPAQFTRGVSLNLAGKPATMAKLVICTRIRHDIITKIIRSGQCYWRDAVSPRNHTNPLQFSKCNSRNIICMAQCIGVMYFLIVTIESPEQNLIGSQIKVSSPSWSRINDANMPNWQMNVLLITIDCLLEEAVSVTWSISQEFGCTNIPCTYPEKVLVAWPREGG